MLKKEIELEVTSLWSHMFIPRDIERGQGRNAEWPSISQVRTVVQISRLVPSGQGGQMKPCLLASCAGLQLSHMRRINIVC